GVPPAMSAAGANRFLNIDVKLSRFALIAGGTPAVPVLPRLLFSLRSGRQHKVWSTDRQSKLRRPTRYHVVVLTSPHQRPLI
ncbi:MAG TPA: hypothetical protein DC047_03990, partial [Blastocatellia bacterium]|nr:hypothetical protein [Blastocatellia bacterium]